MKIKRFLCVVSSLLIVLLFTISLPAQGQDRDLCDKLRNRPGNDDIIIMVDTSLSMINLIDDIRDQLKDFFRCYVKEGDFIVLGTFDSSCRIQFSMEVSKYERDFPLLVSQVDGIIPVRRIYYELENKRWKETDRVTDRVGGGKYTDLGEMIQTVSEILKKYQTPDNRKFLLIYTDAIDDPPTYLGARDIELSDFFKGIKTQDISLGLVACDDDSFERLQGLIQVIDSDGEWQESEKVGVMRNPQTGIDPALILNGVDVESPRDLTLGPVWTPTIDTKIEFHNKRGNDATIKIKQIRVELKSPSGETIDIPVIETPTELTIKAKTKSILPIKTELPRSDTGIYTGHLIFDITSAVRPVPPRIPLEYTQATFCQTHKKLCLAVLLLLCIAAVIAAVLGIKTLYKRLKPQWVNVQFSDKDGQYSSAPKKISRGGELRIVGKTHPDTEQTLNLQDWLGTDSIASIKRKRIAKYQLTDSIGNVKSYRLEHIITLYREPGGVWSLKPGDESTLGKVEQGRLLIATAIRPLLQQETFFT